jgi:hypothetical protein
MLSHDYKPPKLYHCASVSSTAYGRAEGRAEGSLCGELLKFALWDFATQFATEDTSNADYEKCEVCASHEDLNLLLLAEAGEI